MIKVLISAMLLWLSFDWLMSVIGMFQTDNIYMIHALANHATMNAWAMLILAATLIFIYRLERSNE